MRRLNEQKVKNNRDFSEFKFSFVYNSNLVYVISSTSSSFKMQLFGDNIYTYILTLKIRIITGRFLFSASVDYIFCCYNSTVSHSVNVVIPNIVFEKYDSYFYVSS